MNKNFPRALKGNNTIVNNAQYFVKLNMFMFGKYWLECNYGWESTFSFFSELKRFLGIKSRLIIFGGFHGGETRQLMYVCWKRD